MQHPKGLECSRFVRYCEHMNNESFGLRLRRIRESTGVGLRELSRRTGLGVSTLHQWESGKRWAGKAPPADDVQRVADALGVGMAVLLSGDGVSSETQGEPVAPRRRLLTERELFERFGIQPYEEPLSAEGVVASAGSGIGVPQGIDDTLPRRRKGTKHLWEVSVVGDCMKDDIQPGEILIYNDRLSPEIGRIMVALRDEEELLIKRLVLLGEKQFLRPNRGDPVVVDERIRFLGRAVAATRPLW